jgi:TonB family protein
LEDESGRAKTVSSGANPKINSYPDITVQDANISGGTTSIEATVAADGTLKAAHIAVSSGQSDVDEAALTKAHTAYAYKYHAATRHCVPVESKIIIKP